MAPARLAEPTIKLEQLAWLRRTGNLAEAKTLAAQPPDHQTDAWYYVITFDAPAEALAEVTRVLAITEGVMRHIAVNRPKPSAPAKPAAEAATCVPCP